MRARAGACALLILAAGCTAAPAQRGGTFPTAPSLTPGEPPRLAYNDCTSRIAPAIAGQDGADRKLTFSCGAMPVPLDHARPAGKTLSMSVLRVRIAGQHDRIGSLVVNPGGPGGSGVEAVIGLALQLPEEVLQRYDLVGFDPRGVGLSGPLECVPAAVKDEAAAAPPDAVTAADYAAQVAFSTRIATGCVRKYGSDLQFYNTTSTAQDLELLRQALGDSALSYLGYSYGTAIGAVYATLYPGRIRAMVLDGAVDQGQDPVTSSEAQAAGFEDAFTNFAAWCRAQGGSCGIGPDAAARTKALIASATKSPIPTTAEGDQRRATGGSVVLAAVSALYDRNQWPELAGALRRAEDGDAAGVLALDDQYGQRSDDGSYTNILDANLAISCADTAVADQPSDAEIQRLVADWRVKYPLFGPSLALGLTSCAPWTVPRHPAPAVHAPTAAAPILVVGTKHDPATPYAQAQRLTAALGGKAALLSWDGDGHTAYPKTSCISKAVDAYLLSGRVPDPRTTCPGS